MSESRWQALKEKICNDVVDCRRMVKTFPRDLYFVFVLKFLESYGYFALSQVLVIYLHDEFDATDVQAGAIYGFFGAAITGWGLTISWLNDNLGVRKSLMLGFCISACASTMIACARSMDFLLVVLFFVYPFGLAMGIPMLNVAIKRYTTLKTRGLAFGIYYSVMNMAALVSGPLVDAFNVGFGHGMNIGGAHFSGYRLLILTCTVANVCSIFVATKFLHEVKMMEGTEGQRDSEGEGLELVVSSGSVLSSTGTRTKSEDEDDDASSSTMSPLQRGGEKSDSVSRAGAGSEARQSNSVAITGSSIAVAQFTPEPEKPWVVAKELFKSPTFRRFAVLTLLLVNLRAIFRHLDATQPTYLVRCFGEKILKGMIYAINPFMIILLTPVVAGLTKDYDHFDMIKWGGYLSAISPFFPALTTSIWASCLMNILLSLGEAIWSPRLYQYTMNIAPEGREASFSALASAPLFAAKIPVGLMSGYLLSKYIDEDHCDPSKAQLMWLIIGLTTISSPVLITLFDRCLREPLDNRKEKTATEEEEDKQAWSDKVDNEGGDEGEFLN